MWRKRRDERLRITTEALQRIRDGVNTSDQACRIAAKALDHLVASEIDVMLPNDIQAMWDKQRGLCAICLLPLGNGEWHMDHRMAAANGGGGNKQNMQITHARCNMRKHTRDHFEFIQTEFGRLL